MRKSLLALALASVTGTSLAGGFDAAGLDPHTTADFSTRLYYQLEFGGVGARTQTVGLRFENRSTFVLPTPDVVQLRFSGNVAPVVKLAGVELRGSTITAAQGSGGNTFFDYLTPWEWAALGGTVIAIAVVANNAGGNGGSTTGSGGA